MQLLHQLCPKAGRRTLLLLREFVGVASNSLPQRLGVERLHLSSCSNSGAQDARGEEHPSFFPTDPELQIAPAAPSTRGLRECPPGLAVDPPRPWRGTPGVREVLHGSFMYL